MDVTESEASTASPRKKKKKRRQQESRQEVQENELPEARRGETQRGPAVPGSQPSPAVNGRRPGDRAGVHPPRKGSRGLGPGPCSCTSGERTAGEGGWAQACCIPEAGAVQGEGPGGRPLTSALSPWASRLPWGSLPPHPDKHSAVTTLEKQRGYACASPHSGNTVFFPIQGSSCLNFSVGMSPGPSSLDFLRDS